MDKIEETYNEMHKQAVNNFKFMQNAAYEQYRRSMRIARDLYVKRNKKIPAVSQSLINLY